MSHFSIRKYLAEIEAAASQLPAKHQLAFVLWCADQPLKAGLQYLGSRIGPDRVAQIQKLSGVMWEAATTDAALDAGVVVGVRQLLESLDWGDEVPEASAVLDDAAMQAIECLIRACDVVEAPSGRICAEAAERVINHLDFKLDREGVSNPLEAPEMKDEVQRQRQMLRYLASNPVLERGPAGTARMFRG